MPAGLSSPLPDPAERLIEGTLARILVSAEHCSQPALAALPAEELTAILPALSPGGAERIVLDWAARAGGRHRVHVAVIKSAPVEYPIPKGLRLTRIGEESGALEAFARKLAVSSNSAVCLSHLLTAAQRAELKRGGAVPVPVIHNARAGWIDTPESLNREPFVIAVSRACAEDLRSSGFSGRILVIRHLPAAASLPPLARQHWRRAWDIPEDAFVVGMAGGVKPQKAYPFALRVLSALRRTVPDAHLVIVGGPVGRDGPRAWSALSTQRSRLGLERAVVLVGFVADAVRCLPAFDVLLNTSHHEGMSIATLEALAAGLPVVSSHVGGQGEVSHRSLALLPSDADESVWARALAQTAALPPEKPTWIRFPAYRLWTLAHLAAPYRSGRHILFVTANLNAGGAQRSLVHLAMALAQKESLSIAVTGDSTSETFARELAGAGVEVVRSDASSDAFDHAEALIRLARARGCDILVFWNVDAKIKLLVAKTAEALPDLRLVDVSPGHYSFEELAETASFQNLIAYGEAEYDRRLDRLVLKFDSSPPAGVRVRTEVIPNGVRAAEAVKTDYRRGPQPRIAVNGRLAPTKFLVEILEAFRLVLRTYPRAELHILGGVEPRHADYARRFLESAGDALGRSVFVHGPSADVPDELYAYDVSLVLGRHQGCPNACLEALTAGVPIVANDSGGTRELVIPNRTGWLVGDGDLAPTTIASALLEALSDTVEARRRARRGRAHVAKRFSIDRMVERYERMFRSLRKREMR